MLQLSLMSAVIVLVFVQTGSSANFHLSECRYVACIALTYVICVCLSLMSTQLCVTLDCNERIRDYRL